jgi:hypothetical protein
VSKLSKEDIDIIREYFLSLNEGVRNNIRSTIGATMIKYLTILENGFINDDSIDRIASVIGFKESVQDLLLLRNEYYISLAQISTEGNSHPDLEKINANGNRSFQNILKEISDNESFEKDLTLAIKSFERDELKRKFQQYDEEDEFEITDHEMKTAITSVERDIMRKKFEELDNAESINNRKNNLLRYAFAAAIVGLIFAGSYLVFFNQDLNNPKSYTEKDSIQETNESIAKIELPNPELPNLINKTQYRKAVFVGRNSRAFASTTDSITVNVKGFLQQIDTLQKILEGLQSKQGQNEDKSRNQISTQIDSLQALLNTYTFNSSTKNVVINLPNAITVESIISIEKNHRSKIYINIKGTYYSIDTNASPVKLLPIIDKTLIDSLQRIEFLNE